MILLKNGSWLDLKKNHLLVDLVSGGMRSELTLDGELFNKTTKKKRSGAIECIASALDSMERWRGQLDAPLTVLVHSLIVHDAVEWLTENENAETKKKARLAALIHDWNELFFGDISKPFLKRNPVLGSAVSLCERDIYASFDIPQEVVKFVDTADRAVAVYEAYLWANEKQKNALVQVDPSFAFQADFLSQYFAVNRGDPQQLFCGLVEELTK